MITRHEYLNSSDDPMKAHRDFYAQFVNERTISYVVASIGADNITKSTHLHLNDIPLKSWDKIADLRLPLAIKFTDVGDYATNAGLVCVAKEAARQFKEKYVDNKFN